MAASKNIAVFIDGTWNRQRGHEKKLRAASGGLFGKGTVARIKAA